jgi:prophage regulatory protein
VFTLSSDLEKKMQAANDNYRMVSLAEAAKMTSLSRTMVNRYRTEGRFPAAVQLGERRIAFVREEIVAWLDEKIAGRVRVSA